MFGFFKKKKKGAEVMQLRGFPGDIGTLKCLIMAAEKNIKLDIAVLDVENDAHKQADYLKISPFGKYPYIQEDDAIAIGAEAALAYLDTRGNGFFNPKKAQFFGHQNYWWQVAESINDDIQVMLNEAASSKQVGSADKIKIEKVLDELDAFLSGKKFIVGEYSYADVHWTANLYALEVSGHKELIEARPNITGWYTKVKQRPSIATLPTLEDIKQKQLNAA
ncbi:MAG TPA: hypothetical protein DCR13_03690 [Gammaproteobacteria bacterium]|nr:hypothetical protein [Gammaproteobacteria bacterium]